MVYDLILLKPAPLERAVSRVCLLEVGQRVFERFELRGLERGLERVELALNAAQVGTPRDAKEEEQEVHRGKERGRAAWSRAARRSCLNR